VPFGRNGQHYAMRANRMCRECKMETPQLCIWIRYRATDPPTVPTSYERHQNWACETCGFNEEEIKTVQEPTDKIRIINRLLGLGDDYDFIKVDLSSRANDIILRVRTPDFDPSELRAVQNKQRETGFISVAELMTVQKAGFRRPLDVPPKPQPKSPRERRERALRRIFSSRPAQGTSPS
jgi:hypothetical protein